jgi:hypothetical protein
MNWNSIIGVLSTFTMLLPVLVILATRLYSYKSFTALMLYYTSALFYNLLTEGYIHASPSQISFWGITNNLVDIPLMLLFLTYFSTSKKFTKRIYITVLIFLLFELVVVLFDGYNVQSITITMGPGILLIVGIGLLNFIRYVKTAVSNGKAVGKAVMSSAVLFAYGCFSFLYLMYYVFKAHLDENGKVKEEYKADSFLIYFLITIISSSLMCIGIYIESKRIKKLEELKVIRKELSSVYAEENTAVPLRTAMLDFNKDQFN